MFILFNQNIAVDAYIAAINTNKMCVYMIGLLKLFTESSRYYYLPILIILSNKIHKVGNNFKL